MDHDLGKLVYDFRLARQKFQEDLRGIESDVAQTVARIQQKFSSIRLGSGSGASTNYGAGSGAGGSGSFSGAAGGLVAGAISASIDTANSFNIVNAIRSNNAIQASNIAQTNGFNFSQMLAGNRSSYGQSLNASGGNGWQTKYMSGPSAGIIPMYRGRDNSYSTNPYASIALNPGVAQSIHDEIAGEQQDRAIEARSNVKPLSNLTVFSRRDLKHFGQFGTPGAAGINDTMDPSSGEGGFALQAGGGNGGAIPPPPGSGGGAGGAGGWSSKALWSTLAKRFAPIAVAMIATNIAEAMAVGSVEVNAAGQDQYKHSMANIKMGKGIIGSIPLVGSAIGNMVFADAEVRAGFAEDNRIGQLNYNNGMRNVAVANMQSASASYGGLSVSSGMSGLTNANAETVAGLKNQNDALKKANLSRYIAIDGRTSNDIHNQLAQRDPNAASTWKDYYTINWQKKDRDAANLYNQNLDNQLFGANNGLISASGSRTAAEQELLMNTSKSRLGSMTAANAGAALANSFRPNAGLAASIGGNAQSQFSLFAKQFATAPSGEAKELDRALMLQTLTASNMQLGSAQSDIKRNLWAGRPQDFDPFYQSAEGGKNPAAENIGDAFAALTQAIQENNKLLHDLRNLP